MIRNVQEKGVLGGKPQNRCWAGARRDELSKKNIGNPSLAVSQKRRPLITSKAWRKLDLPSKTPLARAGKKHPLLAGRGNVVHGRRLISAPAGKLEEWKWGCRKHNREPKISQEFEILPKR